MKKITLSFLIGVISICTYAQVTFLKEFIVSDYGYETVINTNEIYTFDTLYNVKIYNSNVDEVKTIIIPPDYQYVMFLSKNLFNLSDTYQYISKNIVEDNYCLLDENGVVLFDFEEFSPNFVNGNKLFCEKEIYVNEQYRYEYRVFTLGGSGDNIGKISIDESIIAYPNPTSDFLNIKYNINKTADLFVYNFAGQSIAQYQLDPHSDLIQLNLTNYKPGTYIYRYNSKSGKFIVN